MCALLAEELFFPSHPAEGWESIFLPTLTTWCLIFPRLKGGLRIGAVSAESPSLGGWSSEAGKEQAEVYSSCLLSLPQIAHCQENSGRLACSCNSRCTCSSILHGHHLEECWVRSVSWEGAHGGLCLRISPWPKPVRWAGSKQVLALIRVSPEASSR